MSGIKLLSSLDHWVEDAAFNVPGGDGRKKVQNEKARSVLSRWSRRRCGAVKWRDLKRRRADCPGDRDMTSSSHVSWVK